MFFRFQIDSFLPDWGQKIGQKWQILYLQVICKKTAWWIFFKLHQKNAHEDNSLWWKHHFDRFARRWANWAKLGKNSPFLQLCLFSQKLFDEFLSNYTKWMFIMMSFSIQNAILMDCPKVGKLPVWGQKIGQKWHILYLQGNLRKNSLMNFFQIAPKECSWWQLSLVKAPFW